MQDFGILLLVIDVLGIPFIIYRVARKQSVGWFIFVWGLVFLLGPTLTHPVVLSLGFVWIIPCAIGYVWRLRHVKRHGRYNVVKNGRGLLQSQRLPFCSCRY